MPKIHPAKTPAQEPEQPAPVVPSQLNPEPPYDADTPASQAELAALRHRLDRFESALATAIPGWKPDDFWSVQSDEKAEGDAADAPA